MCLVVTTEINLEYRNNITNTHKCIKKVFYCIFQVLCTKKVEIACNLLNSPLWTDSDNSYVTKHSNSEAKVEYFVPFTQKTFSRLYKHLTSDM